MWDSILGIVDKVLALVLLRERRADSVEGRASRQRALQQEIDELTSEIDEISDKLKHAEPDELDDLREQKAKLIIKLNALIGQ